MANRNQMFQRRQFLRGVGGVTLGLPLLDAFMPKGAKAQTAGQPPFTLIVVHANGVVQAGEAFGGTDPETFWPTATGTLTKAAMDADAATRTTGLLSSYADRLLMVRGVSHSFSDTGCMHASGDLQLLTATKPSGDGNKAIATGESVDTRLARELNPAGREPLVLHAGKYSPGGAGYDIPGYVSYLGPKQPRTYVDSPYKAYQRIIGVVGDGAAMTPADMQAQQQLATRTKSVNDLLRKQIQELLARKDLSGSDVQRLNEHFAAIRDLEIKTTAPGVGPLPAADVAAMQGLDPAPYSLASHKQMIQLQMEVMAFAIASHYTRVAVLKVGDREDDSSFTIGGTTFVYHTASHRSIANGADLCRQVDILHTGYFKGLLDRLAAYNTPTGPLLDSGVAILTNQIANGKHSFNNVPWIFSIGKNTTYLKSGQFVQVKASTNQMLNTILNAAGIRKAGGAPVDDFGDASLAKGVIAGIVA